MDMERILALQYLRMHVRGVTDGAPGSVYSLAMCSTASNFCAEIL